MTEGAKGGSCVRTGVLRAQHGHVVDGEQVAVGNAGMKQNCHQRPGARGRPDGRRSRAGCPARLVAGPGLVPDPNRGTRSRVSGGVGPVAGASQPRGRIRCLSSLAGRIVVHRLLELLDVLGRELRAVDGQRQLVELAGEAEGGLVVLVGHRRAGIGAHVEALAPLHEHRDGLLHLLRRRRPCRPP